LSELAGYYRDRAAEYDELLIRSGFTTGELKRVDTDSNVLAAGPGA